MPQDYADRPLDVRDRLEAQTLADLADGLQIDSANVQVFQEEGNESVIPGSGADEGKPPEAWVVVTFGDEDGVYPGDDFAGHAGVVGAETLLLPFTADLHLMARPADYAALGTAGFRRWKNYWIAQAKRAVMANVQSMEGGVGTGGDELALNTRITGTFGPLASDRQHELIVGVYGVKLYRHLEGQPQTLL